MAPRYRATLFDAMFIKKPFNLKHHFYFGDFQMSPISWVPGLGGIATFDVTCAFK